MSMILGMLHQNNQRKDSIYVQLTPFQEVSIQTSYRNSIYLNIPAECFFLLQYENNSYEDHEINTNDKHDTKIRPLRKMLRLLRMLMRF